MKQNERLQPPGINPQLAGELSRHAIHLNRLQSAVDGLSGGPGGSGGSGVPVYVQTTAPAGSGYVWFQTDGAGAVLDILIG